MKLKLTKTDRLIVNAAAKTLSRPALHCVHLTKGRIEAANGFLLMERKIDYTGEDALLDISDIAQDKGEVIDIIPRIGISFPDTKALYPTTKPVFKIALSKGQVMAALKCFREGEEVVKFTFYKIDSPVKIESIDGEVKGLIMPMQVSWRLNNGK